jgi:GT2 family glycosyltransferase
LVTISVVIPTFHRYEPLRNTVLDLMRQTVPPREIIIVDNTDLADRKEPDYLKSSGSTECVYISSRCTGRVNVARNEGLRRATADYVVLLDDDMELPADFLENFLTVHAEGWDAVTGMVHEDGQLLESPKPSRSPLWYVLRHRHGASRGHTIAVPSCFISMRNRMIQELGYLDEAYIYNYDDYDLGFRIWNQGYTLIHDPRVTGHHLKLPHGGSRKDLTGRLRKLNKYTAKYYFLAKHFTTQAAKTEFVNDLMFILWNERRRPMRCIKSLKLVFEAFRSYPAYSNGVPSGAARPEGGERETGARSLTPASSSIAPETR